MQRLALRDSFSRFARLARFRAARMKTEHRAEIRAEREAIATEKPARRLAPGIQRGIAFKGKNRFCIRATEAVTVSRRLCFRRPVLQHQRFMRRPLRWQRIDFVWLSTANANANNTAVSSRELQLAQVPDAGRARTKRISLHSDVILPPSSERQAAIV